MRTALGFLSIGILACLSLCQEQPMPAQPPLLRKAFTVELQVEDKKQPYIEHFENVSFVADNSVYLFPGDDFGVDLTVTNGKVVTVVYDPRPKKADVEFTFTQLRAANNKRPFMILGVENRLARVVAFNAVLTLPEKKKDHETHIFKIQKGENRMYSWPSPTMKVALVDFRF